MPKPTISAKMGALRAWAEARVSEGEDGCAFAQGHAVAVGGEGRGQRVGEDDAHAVPKERRNARCERGASWPPAMAGVHPYPERIMWKARPMAWVPEAQAGGEGEDGTESDSVLDGDLAGIRRWTWYG